MSLDYVETVLQTAIHTGLFDIQSKCTVQLFWAPACMTAVRGEIHEFEVKWHKLRRRVRGEIHEFKVNWQRRATNLKNG